MFRRQLHSRLRYAPLLGIALLLLAARGQKVSRQQDHPKGQWTSDRVIEMSRPICQAIAPQLDTLSLSAEPLGRLGRIWQVRCRDKAGRDIAYLTWNAETGKICQMGCPMMPYACDNPVMSVREAAITAASWLKVLRMYPLPAPLRLISASLSPGAQIWILECKAGNERADIKLEAHTGDLFYASLWKEPTHPLKPTPDDYKAGGVTSTFMPRPFRHRIKPQMRSVN